MKAGFTLIELTIGLFLSAIIGSALYSSFFVTNRVVDSADNFITFDTRSVLIENQLEKDLAGAFVPDESELVKKVTKKDGKKSENQQEEQPKEKTKTVEEKPMKPIEKIFYSTNGADGRLDVLTFITNNPVKIYERAKNVKAKPRIARIVYRLVPQDGESTAFTLLRQESSELDFTAYDLKNPKAVRGYELATGIKTIKVEYTYPVQKQPEAQEKEKKSVAQSKQPEGQKEKPPKPEYKIVATWDVETKKDEQQREQPKIPQFITVVCELWDTKQEREQTFTFNYELLTFLANTMPKKAKKIAMPKTQEPETAAETITTPQGK